jgi:hypothetical protein
MIVFSAGRLTVSNAVDRLMRHTFAAARSWFMTIGAGCPGKNSVGMEGAGGGSPGGWTRREQWTWCSQPLALSDQEQSRRQQLWQKFTALTQGLSEPEPCRSE